MMRALTALPAAPALAGPAGACETFGERPSFCGGRATRAPRGSPNRPVSGAYIHERGHRPNKLWGDAGAFVDPADNVRIRTVETGTRLSRRHGSVHADTLAATRFSHAP